MASILLQLWKGEAFRDHLMRFLMQDDLKVCRLVCRDLAVTLAPLVFADMTIAFRSGTLTRPSCLAVLGRIGSYVQTLTFKIPHTAETFLPPVIDSTTGKEQTFLYFPQGSEAHLTDPRYGSWEMTDLLVKQYPPLFHAATDVHSFVRALSSMPNLQHLRINCDGQIPSHRYRRSIVDYALISLRIAVEKAPLKLLDSLSLLSIHPAAVLYLQPTLGFGASPASRKRWLQINHLTIHMTSFSNEAGPTDHLKLLHTYMQSFPALRVLRFHWKGHKGLSPISLATETCLQRQCTKVTTTSYGVSKIKASIRPLRLPTLEVMELVNVIIDASQIASFILDHRRSLWDFNLQDISLRTGTWDEALAPLTQLSGSDRWKQTQKKHESTINVPIFLSPVGNSQKRLEEVIQVVGRQHEGLRGLLRNTRARDQLSGRPDHMKRLLPVSVFSVQLAAVTSRTSELLGMSISRK